jgi:hypothetical protein
VKEENLQRCPNCKLTNPPDALRCDCGYDFTTGKLPEAAIRTKHSSKLRVLKGLLLFAWFIIGPILCYVLADRLFPSDTFVGYPDPGRVSRYVIGSILAAMPMFFLPILLWLRFVAFVIYTSIVMYVLPVVLVLIACYGFGSCP